MFLILPTAHIELRKVSRRQAIGCLCGLVAHTPIGYSVHMQMRIIKGVTGGSFRIRAGMVQRMSAEQ
jgi:hypothetical protein